MTHSNEGNNKYLKTEAFGGAFMIIAASLGFICGNSQFATFYNAFVNFPIQFRFLSFDFTQTLLFWINDGLIAIFFFLIGLEIKSTLYDELQNDKSHLTAPFAAAIAGVIVPATIFTLFNYDNATNMRGWAIPTVIDTAFVVGILSMIGPSISRGLKMFIMTLSIIDDIIAVLVIAIFYVANISNVFIIASLSVVGILTLLNQAGVKHTTAYISIGILLWICVLKSGIHTSIAGVLLAATIPINTDDHGASMVHKLRNILHPWVSFFILPLFAFTNTGFDLGVISVKHLFVDPLALGIILGMFIGKQLGIFGIISILYNRGIIALPPHTTWWQMYGVSVLCGVGFTISLFIGVLAFNSGANTTYDEIVKTSVFIASLLSATVGSIILYLCRKKHQTLAAR